MGHGSIRTRLIGTNLTPHTATNTVVKNHWRGGVIVDQIYKPVSFMGCHRVDKSTPARKTTQDPVFLSVDYADARSGTESAGGDVNTMHLWLRHGAGDGVE